MTETTEANIIFNAAVDAVNERMSVVFAGVEDRLSTFLTNATERVEAFQRPPDVVVDMTPVADAIRELADLMQAQFKVLTDLIRVLREQPPPQVHPEINLPPLQPQITVSPAAHQRTVVFDHDKDGRPVSATIHEGSSQ